MAKSIWRPGQPMTRFEKKLLRKLIPHPNKGRALYQWKAESHRISDQLNVAIRNKKLTGEDLRVSQTEIPILKPGKLKRELQAALKKSTARLSGKRLNALSALYVKD